LAWLGKSSLTLHLLKMELTQCSKTSGFNTQTLGKNPQWKLSLLQHGESLKLELFTSMWRILQLTSVWLKNFASRKPNSPLPSPSSYAVVTTISYPVSYNSITISTPKQPTESTNLPVLLYPEKEYTIDVHWITLPCTTASTPTLSQPHVRVRLVLNRPAHFQQGHNVQGRTAKPANFRNSRVSTKYNRISRPQKKQSSILGVGS